MTTNVSDAEEQFFSMDPELRARMEEAARRLDAPIDRVILAGLNFMAFYADLRDQDGSVFAVIGDDWKHLDIDP